MNPSTFGQLAAGIRAGRPFLKLGDPSRAVASTAVSASGNFREVLLPDRLGALLGRLMLSDVRSRFTTGTTPDGAKWAPLRHVRPNGGDKPLLDTGFLMNSIAAAHDSRGVTLTTAHPGAALLNAGGTVRAKNKMLAIPLTKEAKRSGGPRRWQGPPLRFRPTGKARRFLLVAGTGPQAVAQFLLVDEVTVPGREFWGLTEDFQRDAFELVSDWYGRGEHGGG